MIFFAGFFVGGALRDTAYGYARAPLWLAIAICSFGIAWRVWGACYIGASVVFDSKIVTDALYVSGPYRYTRNPLYFGLYCYAIGIALIGPPLTVAIIALGVIALVESLVADEERRLRTQFGERYDAFVRAVPRIVPALRPCVPDDGLHPSLTIGLRSEAYVIALAVVSFAFAAFHR
jgi:protein-S-isoprenylcysteine O-methyltransferase Ste14